jgi:hypothetical protein
MSILQKNADDEVIGSYPKYIPSVIIINGFELPLYYVLHSLSRILIKHFSFLR